MFLSRGQRPESCCNPPRHRTPGLSQLRACQPCRQPAWMATSPSRETRSVMHSGEDWGVPLGPTAQFCLQPWLGGERLPQEVPEHCTKQWGLPRPWPAPVGVGRVCCVARWSEAHSLYQGLCLLQAPADPGEQWCPPPTRETGTEGLAPGFSPGKPPCGHLRSEPADEASTLSNK